jgi:hypothetical protein
MSKKGHPKFIQIAVGSANHTSDDPQDTFDNIYALDEKGEVYVFCGSDDGWAVLDEIEDEDEGPDA